MFVLIILALYGLPLRTPYQIKAPCSFKFQLGPIRISPLCLLTYHEYEYNLFSEVSPVGSC